MDKFMEKYMSKFMNIYVYSILYVIYLYFFLDTLLLSPKHWLQSQISGVFLICSAVFLAYTMIYQEKPIKKSYFIRKELTTFGILFPLLLVFLFQYGRPLSNWEVVLSQFLLMSNMFMIGKIYSKYDKKNLFLFLSFIVPTVFILWNGFKGEIPAECLNNIKNILYATDRVRYDFNFNHPNTLGNLIAGIVIISFIFIFNTLKQKEWIVLKIFKMLMPIILSVPLLFMLICTGSRTSILSLILFVAAGIYFLLTNLKFIPPLIKIILKVVIIIAVTIPTYNYLSKNFDKILDDSNRRSNFDVNLKLMDTQEKKNVGLGLIYYGDFRWDGINIEEQETSNIDNYYLYMYVCTGKIGLAIFVIAFLIIFIKLYLNMYINPSLESSIIVAAFLAHMFLGIGETCILYFTFLSGMLLTTTYVITMDEFYNDLSTKEFKFSIKRLFSLKNKKVTHK